MLFVGARVLRCGCGLLVRVSIVSLFDGARVLRCECCLLVRVSLGVTVVCWCACPYV